jgi:drug/metabolite transporter (DMT)-like permease
VTKNQKGITLMLVSAFFFSLMSMFVKLAGDLPSAEKAFFRNFLGMLITAVPIIRQRISFRMDREQSLYMLLRVGSGTIAILCNYYAFSHLILSDASTIGRVSPFFVLLFSYLFIGEKPTKGQLACLVLAFAGVALVARPACNSSRLGYIIALIGAVNMGLAQTGLRKVRLLHVDANLVIFCFSTFSTITCLLASLPVFKMPSTAQLLILLFVGLSGTCGQFALTGAYTYAPGAQISVYDYSEMLFATIFSICVFGEFPSSLSFIGYGVMIAAGLAMFKMQRKAIAT